MERSCVNCKYTNLSEDDEKCVGCIHNAVDKFVPMTNADRIRNMTDDELARFMRAWCCHHNGWCDDCTSINGEWCNGLKTDGVREELEWLRKNVEV